MTILPSSLIIPMLLFFSSLQFSYATDTITQLEPFTDGSTLVSKGGTFELGFFNPSNTSLNRYVGIWYKNIPDRRVVWVANRDNPIKDNSSKLIINQQGNLVLLNKNDSLLWSANLTTSKVSATSTHVVQLLDNGNLVLRDEKVSTNFLWQSFDYPCDTLLPEMKFGMNKKRGLNRHVTAWKNWDDPSSGDLTTAVEMTSNPEALMWKGGKKFYRTGPWTGPFSGGIIGFRPNPIFVFEFVNNEDEVYYVFTLKNSSLISIIVFNATLSLRQRLVWTPESGTWNVYTKLPQDSCDAYNVCGPNGNCIIDESPMCQCLDGFKPKSPQLWNATEWSQGCVRSGNWSCGDKKRDGFRKFTGMKLPDTMHSWVNKDITLDECKAKCFENCSCSAYSHLDHSGPGSGCSIWFGDLLDMRVSQGGQVLYVRTSDIDAANGKWKKVVLAVSITVAILLAVLSYIYIAKIKDKKEADNATLMEERHNEEEHEDFDLPLFDLATILKATNNFSNNNKLGEGGFGPVYKGILQDGREVAVKRLSGSSRQGPKEFKNEVILCAKLQHRNLVKVLGCCVEEDEKMLLYEYMPNKSLDSFLFDPFQRKWLDWHVRFSILHAIARGLLYLHEDSRLRIIHRDLKASNILLDNNMNPKISDFGLARMCGGDQIEGKTSRIVGTYGYMAPEYVIHGLFSIKSDVFSFGVLLLEIISGKKNRILTYYEIDQNLIGHAWRLWQEGIPHKLIDDSLKDSCVLFEALRCIQIGLLCVQHDPEDRPNMSSVVVMLSSKADIPQPKQPSFLIKKVQNEGETSSGRQTTSSMNDVTISILNAR